MTPAVLIAKRARVRHAVHEYAHDSASPSYGHEAAEKLGVDPARVFKTLLTLVDGKPVVALVPVARSLDLKALAASTGGKRARLAEMSEAERVTGYVAGGISPLGQRRSLPTFIDETAMAWESIFVSAGRRGLEIELPPLDLQRLTHGQVATIAR